MTAPPAATLALHCDGTRLVPAAETLRRLRPFLHEFGITRVANVTGLDDVGIPTVMVTRPNGRSLSVSQGKGLTLDAAKASGVMEAVEQYHAENVPLPIRYASAKELRDQACVVDIFALPRRATPLTQAQRLLWVSGERFGSGEPVWVPYELVHLDFTLPLPPGTGHFLSGSSGLASGNHRLEAIAHGLCEVIERDAATLFYLESSEQVSQRRIDLASIRDAACCDLLRRFRAASVLVAVWDLTSDLAVPCYLVETIDEQPSPFRPTGLARGAGCHLDPALALRRALCEAAQTRLTRISGTRDDVSSNDTLRLRSEAHMAATRHALAATPPPGSMRSFPEPPARASPGASLDPPRVLERDLDELRERLASAGCSEIVVTDLSRPAYPVSVVRVLVPGLEGFVEIPGYVPGARARARGATA